MIDNKGYTFENIRKLLNFNGSAKSFSTIVIVWVPTHNILLLSIIVITGNDR